MKTLIISDPKEVDTLLHLPNPDLLICLGDIYYGDVIKLDKAFDCKKIGVLGNHDPFSLYEGTNFEHIHKSIINFNGVSIAGFDGCPRYNIKNTPQFTEEETFDFMNNLDYVDIFIAHSNPQFAFSADEKDSHRGFKSFGDYIKNKQPNFFLHGHMHESLEYPIGNTNIISIHPYHSFVFKKN